MLSAASISDSSCVQGATDNQTPSTESFSIKIVDDEGVETKDILSSTYFVFTETKLLNGEVITIYTLYANISLHASSRNILIESTEGEFNIFTTVTGLSSYLHETGLRMELSNSENTYTADLTASNGFKDVYYRDDDSSRAVFKPNVKYPISIKTLADVEHEVAPEDVQDIVITFTAHLKEDLHHIAFFSEGKLVDSYVLEDGETIRPLPIVEREGYEFMAWISESGEEIKEGRVVTDKDKDIISTAQWKEIPQEPDSNFNWIIPVIVAAIITSVAFILFLFKRRRLE